MQQATVQLEKSQRHLTLLRLWGNNFLLPDRNNLTLQTHLSNKVIILDEADSMTRLVSAETLCYDMLWLFSPVGSHLMIMFVVVFWRVFACCFRASSVEQASLRCPRHDAQAALRRIMEDSKLSLNGGFHEWLDGLCHGKCPSKMDENRGYPFLETSKCSIITSDFMHN